MAVGRPATGTTTPYLEAAAWRSPPKDCLVEGHVGRSRARAIVDGIVSTEPHGLSGSDRAGGIHYGPPAGRLCFLASASSEGRILALSFSFEQATQARRLPAYTPAH